MEIMEPSSARVPKVLVFVSYYLPGYKSGGPLRTIQNIVLHLGGEFEFWIVTRDRDLGDQIPYPGVTSGVWQQVGRSKVMYLTPWDFSLWTFKRLLNVERFDLVYLNSFFDARFTLAYLALRRSRLIPAVPTLLAPRGEFAVDALKLGAKKKSLYLFFVRILRLTAGVVFQGSSLDETADIVSTMKIDPKHVKTAIDLPAPVRSPQARTNTALGSSVLRVIFLSRISPMKNLDYALRVLRTVDVPVEFDIYGPLEDTAYWHYCRSLAEQLPATIVWNYRGMVDPAAVGEVFSRYDLFLFPTRGENYGHVVAESLAVGTPVLISDRTPWRGLKDEGLGWDIALESEDEFVRKLNSLGRLDPEIRMLGREKIIARAQVRLNDPAIVDRARQLFFSALRG